MLSNHCRRVLSNFIRRFIQFTIMPPKKHSAVVAQRDLFANSAVNGDNDDEEEEEEEEEEPSGQFLDDEYIAGGEHDSHIKVGFRRKNIRTKFSVRGWRRHGHRTSGSSVCRLQ